MTGEDGGIGTGSAEQAKVSVSLQVRNTGPVTVVKWCSSMRERVPRLPRPDKQLEAFAKVMLEQQEETEVSFE